MNGSSTVCSVWAILEDVHVQCVVSGVVLDPDIVSKYTYYCMFIFQFVLHGTKIVVLSIALSL